MENTIYIFDTSSIVKNAPILEVSDYHTFPTNGLHKFNDELLEVYGQMKPGDIAVACFDGSYSKLRRKAIYPYYKINKKIPGFDNVVNPEIAESSAIAHHLSLLDRDTQKKVILRKGSTIQLDYLKLVLPLMGINILYQEDLEAYDFIYSVCMKFGTAYNVVIYSDNSDLYDCMAYCDEFKMISASNDEELSLHIGENINKIFEGKISDNIPSLSSHITGNKLNILQTAITTGAEPITTIYDNDRLMTEYLLTEEDCTMLQTNYKLAIPVIDPDLELDVTPINITELANYLSSLGFNEALDNLGYNTPFINDEVQSLRDYAFALVPSYVKEFYTSN